VRGVHQGESEVENMSRASYAGSSMTCAICGDHIPRARLIAVPTTRICVKCKQQNDEPPLGIHSPLLRRSMAENSLSDPEEMGREARQIRGDW
jgi:hypothetical protein